MLSWAEHEKVYNLGPRLCRSSYWIKVGQMLAVLAENEGSGLFGVFFALVYLIFICFLPLSGKRFDVD